ncbi:uncharacterized protein LOC144105611 [Amblyomma americanum]
MSSPFKVLLELTTMKSMLMLVCAAVGQATKVCSCAKGLWWPFPKRPAADNRRLHSSGTAGTWRQMPSTSVLCTPATAQQVEMPPPPLTADDHNYSQKSQACTSSDKLLVEVEQDHCEVPEAPQDEAGVASGQLLSGAVPCSTTHEE